MVAWKALSGLSPEADSTAEAMPGTRPARMRPSANVIEIQVDRLSRSRGVWPSSGRSAKNGVRYTVSVT